MQTEVKARRDRRYLPHAALYSSLVVISVNTTLAQADNQALLGRRASRKVSIDSGFRLCFNPLSTFLSISCLVFVQRLVSSSAISLRAHHAAVNILVKIIMGKTLKIT